MKKYYFIPFQRNEIYRSTTLISILIVCFVENITRLIGYFCCFNIFKSQFTYLSV